MSPRARQAKGQARLTRYEELVAEAQSVEKRADRLEIEIPFTRRLGDKVIEAKDLRKGYGDRLAHRGSRLQLPPAGIVGVIGPNGAGKTTLFRMITGTESTRYRHASKSAPRVDLAYVDQTRDALKAENTVYQEISGGLDIIKVGNREINSRAYVASLNFKGSDQQKKVGTLSGGERNRVHLAKMLQNRWQCHPARRALQRPRRRHSSRSRGGLIAFPGCAVVISHDRWFLDRICTHILAFEGDSQVHEYAQGKVRFYEGNWTEYETFITSRYGPDALMPRPRGRARLALRRIGLLVTQERGAPTFQSDHSQFGTQLPGRFVL